MAGDENEAPVTSTNTDHASSSSSSSSQEDSLPPASLTLAEQQQADDDAKGFPKNRFTLGTTKLWHIPPSLKTGEPVKLGIDEAGRGPVMGPMVYAAAFWKVEEVRGAGVGGGRLEGRERSSRRECGGLIGGRGKLKRIAFRFFFRSQSNALTCATSQSTQFFPPIPFSHSNICKDAAMIAMGFDDSKALDEKTRDGLFQRMLRTHAQLGWVIHSIPATELAGKMLMKEATSLNKISHNSAADMLSLVLSEGVCVTEVFVDTVGDPEMYQKKLEGLFAHHTPRISFTVAKKADSLYKTVSAASIAAKVTRDRAISGWVWEESFRTEGGKEGGPQTNFGSGYPGDARCSDWLKGNSDNVFGFPSLVRFSWSTARDLMEKECVKVEWEEDEDDGGGLPAGTSSIEAFIKPKPGEPKKARKRAKYFQQRGMETVGDF